MNKPDSNYDDSGEYQETDLPPNSGGQNKEGKKTSRLAIASTVFVFLGFLSLLVGAAIGSHNVVVPFVALGLLVIGVVLGISALVVIRLKRKRLGGIAHAATAIVFGVFLLSGSIICITKLLQCRRAVVCLNNLHQLSIAVHQYAEAHEDQLPAADRWCDLLVEHQPDLSKEIFKCPTAKQGVCHYAFNKNLDGMRSAEIPKNVVLIFESDDDWNLSGGEELLRRRHKGNGDVRSNAVFGDFSIRICYDEKEPLRWNPEDSNER